MVSANANSVVNCIGTLTMNINGLPVARDGSQGGNMNGVMGVVANGGNYSVTSSGCMSYASWYELR